MPFSFTVVHACTSVQEPESLKTAKSLGYDRTLSQEFSRHDDSITGSESKVCNRYNIML